MEGDLLMPETKTTRASKAGESLGDAIVEMIHLMYQNNTAAAFLRGLYQKIIKEMQRRGI